MKNKNFEDAYFKALQDNDLNALSKIIYTLAEDNEGKHSFNSSEEVYEFLEFIIQFYTSLAVGNPLVSSIADVLYSR